MSEISGVAKRHDDAPVDYVSIFNWSDGKCIAQVVPDATGAWEYAYSKSLEVGITYVANGCEPITHGAYEFFYASTTPEDTILHYSFDGSVLDESVNELNGIKTGNANFVAGRKAGTQALEFINGCVQTPQVLLINSDKLTISFWLGTSQESPAIIFEASSNFAINNNSYICVINDSSSKGAIQTTLKGVGLEYNTVKSELVFDNSYQHVLVEIDRSKDASNENKIYVNNVLTSVFSYSDGSQKEDTSSNLLNDILYIGQRNQGVLPFVGKLQDFRVYNRTLTTDERSALFNE